MFSSEHLAVRAQQSSAHLKAVGHVVQLAAEAAAFVHVTHELLGALAVGRVLRHIEANSENKLLLYESIAREHSITRANGYLLEVCVTHSN